MGALSLAAVVLVAILGAVYQIYLGPILKTGGVFRKVQSFNNDRCTFVPEFEGCEKVIYRPETNLLYLACSNPSARRHWLPYYQLLNVSGKPQDDYIATYNIETADIRKFDLQWSSEEARARGIAVHGMDIVPSASKSSELFFYLVNHRAPLEGDVYITGADSVVEIFSASIGSHVLNHVGTVKHDVLKTPNDLVGGSDGKSFWFSNDHYHKTGIWKAVETYLMKPWSYAGYCELGVGCKVAASHIYIPNGIARSHTNDTFYVASSGGNGIHVLEKQADNTLVLTDVISTDRVPIDNLSVDSNGAVIGAFLPKGIEAMNKMKGKSIKVPSGVYRLTVNTGESSYYGEKYKLDVLFQDTGDIVDGITTATHIPEKNLLVMHGIVNRRLVLCKI